MFAVDGSKVNLPKSQEIRDHFGFHVNGSGTYPQALISECFDVYNGLTLDMRVAPCRVNERNLAVLHLKKTQENDVILYDRNYTGFWHYALHEQHNRYFVMRISTRSQYPYVNSFMKEEGMEKVFTLDVSEDAEARCKKRKIMAKSLKLRMIKVVLPTDEIEVLITNLVDSDAYPIDEFGRLYAKRWAVEEDYKTLKTKLNIEDFSGKSVKSIQQDIQAKVLVKNLTTLLTLASNKIIKRQTATRQHHYKTNFTQALSKMKDRVIFIVKSDNPLREIKNLIYWFVKRNEPVRPHRSYSRKTNKMKKSTKSGNYRQVR